jgi:hypothetical protein
VKFKSKASAQEIQSVLEDFESIPTKIEGVCDIEWGPNNSPENLNDGYSHCIQITFKNEEGRQNYLPHPEHEILKKKFINILEKIVVFDYNI